MTQLRHTAALMQSDDYKERFIAEYLQVKIRLEKLENMINEWEVGRLNFVPTCPRGIYDDQIDGMKKYLDVLVRRAKIENVDLTPYEDVSTIQDVKLIRKELSSIIESLSSEGLSDNAKQAVYRIKEGRMWLGMELAVLGGQYPYPDGANTANDKVNPAT